MPYKSDAQRKFFNANRKKLTAQGVNVDEWNASSRGLKLPVKKHPEKTVKVAAQEAVLAQALTAILGEPRTGVEKTSGSPAVYTGLYGVSPAALVKLCTGSLPGMASGGNSALSVLDETPCGAVYTEFPTEKAAQSGTPATETGQTVTGVCQPATEAGQPATEACEPSLVKLAVDAVIRSFGGPLVPARSPVRASDLDKLALAAAPAAPGPLADSVGMLRNGGQPNPMQAVQAGPALPAKPPASPAQNPINMYGPLSQAGTIGGGMFGQKMTETGSLKLSAWADRLVRLRRRRDPDGISTQPVDACLRGEG